MALAMEHTVAHSVERATAGHGLTWHKPWKQIYCGSTHGLHVDSGIVPSQVKPGPRYTIFPMGRGNTRRIQKI